jgi:hypothetical protein
MGLKMKVKAAVVLLVVVFLLLPSASRSFESQQKALRGLKGVRVLVEPLYPVAERLGLSKDQITTDVELRLRKAGVRVLSEKEMQETPGLPFLYVNINTYIPTGQKALCAFTARVDLAEVVTLARGYPSVGLIWHKDSIGTVGTQSIREIRGEVGDLVDEFINDYLAANPKRQGN